MFVYFEIVVAVAAMLLMSRVIEGVQGERRYRRATLFIGGLVVCVALTILTIGARSPYTHANLSAGYEQTYDRTTQAVVGPPVPFTGIADQRLPAQADRVTLGAALFMAKGCSSCHGITGQGSVVGPDIGGQGPGYLREFTMEGPNGMPAFAAGALSDDDLEAIYAYLKAMVGRTP